VMLAMLVPVPVLRDREAASDAEEIYRPGRFTCIQDWPDLESRFDQYCCCSPCLVLWQTFWAGCRINFC
jgi:hypothetical protein